jgi:hypothetical protein
MHKYSHITQVTITILNLLSLLLLLSCNNSNSNKEDEETSTPVPVMAEVPSFISDQETALSYLTQHFWDNTDINDTLYLQNHEELKRFFIKYLQHLCSCDSSIASLSIKNWTKTVLQSPQNMQDFMLDLAENTLYDPNSPVRNETLYISILEVLSKDSALMPVIRQRYSEQLHIARQNRPGKKANDFAMVTADGKKISLYDFKGKYTLIMFYEPDCPACEASLGILNNNKTFEKASGLLNLLAVYTGKNLQAWRESISKFKQLWTVAHDLNMEITTKRLYDRRPSPSFYLLDKNHVVLLKDGTTSQLISILQKLYKQSQS